MAGKKIFRVLASILAVLVLLPGSFSPAQADQGSVTITANTAGAQKVGVESYVWGSVSGVEVASIWTEALVNDSWSRSQTSQINEIDGSYVIELTYGKNTAGRYAYRVVVEAEDGATHTSEVVYLRRDVVITANTAGARPVGTTTRVWGTALGAKNATVWTEVRVNGVWSRSQVATTDSRGRYQIELTYGKNAANTYKYRVGVEAAGRTTYSKTVTIRRTPIISFNTVNSKIVGLTTNAWGTARGAGNASIQTQVLVNGTWRRSQVSTTNRWGSYKIPLTYGQDTPGKYRYRVVVTTPDGHTYASGSRTIIRRLPNLDSRCYTSGNVICIDRHGRKLYWVKRGRVDMVADVRTGRPGMETRLGVHRVYHKSRNHFSSIYHVNMPYSMFFSGGQAVHYSSEFARIGYGGAGGSHGCVNMRDYGKIARLYGEVRVGTRVVVYDS